MILARVAADEAEVLTLAVDPDGAAARARRARSCPQAMRTAGERGARLDVLEVAEDNARRAGAVCRRSASPRSGGGRRYYRGGVDALVLRAAIPCGSATP